jgi:hypothetical protein
MFPCSVSVHPVNLGDCRPSPHLFLEEPKEVPFDRARKETRHANNSSRSDCPRGQPASTLFDVGVSSSVNKRA